MSAQAEAWNSSSSVVEKLINIGAPLLVIGLGIAGFVALRALYKPVPQQVPQQPLPIVQVAKVSRHQGGLELMVDGIVVPFREIQIAVEVDGRIVEKTPECEAGTFVKKGTLLLRVDPSDYQIEVARAREQYRQAEAALAEWQVQTENVQKLLEIAREQLEIQKRDFARMERLFGSNTITQAEFDAARRTLLMTEQEVVNLENQLRTQQTSRERLESVRDQAAVQLRKAELDVARTEIRAPADGVVVSDLVEQNSFVRKGTTVVVFEDTSNAQIRSQLTMRQAAWLWAMLGRNPADVSPAPGEAYRLPRLPVTVEWQHEGHVFAWKGVLDGYEGLGVDERTRMIPCRIVVPEPTSVVAVRAEKQDARSAVEVNRRPPALVRGMYVSIKIHVDPESPVLRLPERALQPGNIVGRVRDGKLRMVPVEVAQVSRGGALVLATPDLLQEGDGVAVSPTPFVENNPLAFSEEGLPVEEQPVL